MGSHRARMGIVLGALVLASGLVLFVSMRLDRVGYFDYNFFQNCTSTSSCSLLLNWAPSGYDLDHLESIARTDASLPDDPPGDGCVGFCFNAIVESVDEDDPHLARVSIVSETRNERTPAIVERSRIQGEARGAERDGLPVRFACFDRLDGENPPRFESCVQMLAER